MQCNRTTGKSSAQNNGNRSGQSMLETLFAVMIICIFFFGMFQVSQLFIAKEILQHATARAARARTVGFDSWMCEKSMLVASIPNAGAMVTPQSDFDNAYLQDLIDNNTPGDVWDASLNAHPPSQKVALELARIPFFLGSYTRNHSRIILDYENWETLSVSGISGTEMQDTITVNAEQEYPLMVDVKHWLYTPLDDNQRGSTVTIEGEHVIENHYSLYLRDLNW